MNIINNYANQTIISVDPEWYFLAEFSFSEFMSNNNRGREPAAGLLYQTLLKMGIPLESIKDMCAALTEYADEAQVRFKPESIDLPDCIRVFFPSKTIGAAKSANTARLSIEEQAMEPAHIIHPSSGGMNGGWGYYAIEKGRDIVRFSDQEPGRVVELYIYQEGK